ncbi:ATP-binding cassette transporter CGR1 [Fusarium venenatum]|nr:ATP-binding cassette transporter CGR1 [Fusarium venenatum]
MAVPSKTVQDNSVVESHDSSGTETLPADGFVPEQTEVEAHVSETSSKILDIIFDYALNKFNDSKERLESGRPKFLAVINKFVVAGTQVNMCLPAFPFKSANKAYKVFGILPDKAEELSLGRLNTMCVRISEIYPPGAQCIIISDGIVYNDLLSISDRDTWAYGQELRKLASAKEFKHIGFSRIKDLIDFPMPQDIREIAYVANATNFRRAFLNRFGKDDIDIDKEIKNNPDTMMTYLGYRRFLESDLKHIFPVGVGRTANDYRRDVRFLAKQMLIRGYAFAGAVKNGFPNHLRLSIHHSTGQYKISMSLLDTRTGFTTPWHCCVARMANGEWTSAPMGDYLKDPNMKVVHENGRPSYFQETINETSTEEVSAAQPVRMTQPKVQDEPQDTKLTILSLFTGEEEERLTVLAKSISSELKQQDRKSINPFYGSENPALDPHSSEFDIAAWLQAVMSITTRDPEKYPRGVAGVAYKDLSAHGVGEATDYQKTFGNYPFELVKFAKKLMSQGESAKIQILRDFDGLIRSGEMLLVLGRPGSGCSTFLKTISGETSGFKIGEESYLNYQGIPKESIHKDFRGECIYQAETDAHFPQLTVGQTLDCAGRARAPRTLIDGITRKTYVTHLRDVVMAAFGLSHTVGNDFVRGVSGGERKRVSIAEAAIGGSALQCWVNSTQGLDSATALEFVRTLRTSTKFTGATALVSVYQASQSIYDVFYKVTLLYEGLQIYFGNIHPAKQFFIDMGFECAPRQVTADFLTSLTNPLERRIRPGFQGKTPSSPDGFAAAWKQSKDRALLLKDIDEFNREYPIGGPSLDSFKHFRKTIKATSQRAKSPYNLSIPQQVALCIRRGFQSLRSNVTMVIVGSLFNAIMALIVGTKMMMLMRFQGITGAGKTTLLDVLANRTSVGIVGGDFLVNGQPRNTGFQPAGASREDKLQYVDHVIDTLEMRSYADAIVGVPGEGLNIEQRKRLTIGVELAANPALLLFLDEPTSGLDSQTAWSICQLLRRLADAGQAILCTIHQPSAHLFQVFDRLLFPAMGGKTIYFGDIGPSSKAMTSYFERNGARPCGPDENPAEWMLGITGSLSEQDWPVIWNDSPERKAVKAELAMKKLELSRRTITITNPSDIDAISPFAASFTTQLHVVVKRVFQQYWRTPSYLYSKVALCLSSALFIGFSFWQLSNSLHGLQNQMYAIFMLLVIFINVCSQIMPHYDAQRELYQSRESPSKTYSWQVFVLSNLLVEIPWNSLSALLIFVSWCYPIGLRHNAIEANEGPEREALMFLFILAFMNFAGTFTNMVLSAVGSAEAAGNLTNLLHSLSLIFCRVLVSPDAMPGFWIFMYRASPISSLAFYLLVSATHKSLARRKSICVSRRHLL